MIEAGPLDDVRLAIHRSRWLIDDFRLLRPRNVGEAVAHRYRLGPRSAYMAGGLDLINSLKYGRRLDHLIYLPSIPNLGEIVETPATLLIGCLVTHRAFQESAAVARHFPDLVSIWGTVANVRVREKGSLAGNLMAGNGAYDVAPLLGALGAELVFEGFPDGTQVEPLDRLDAAGIADGPILTAIRLPIRPGRRLIYNRELRPALTVALAADFQGAQLLGGRVAIGCAHPRPVMVPLILSSPIVRRDLPAVAADLAQATLRALPKPTSDHSASSDYRRRMAGVLLRRQLSAFGSEDDD